ncbi:hypothetical protein Sp245p_34360 (plasmid) [Azospirillum baldaniorum]|uniref:Uncharacterized protein n=1 Tax=Azospirillum baldaniorum TaxID=1064539 RepID=A0A9P1K0J4_9PROT|nr:hypothetical protein Sp245p_34360 [Azospirillum baldaniorum]CCD03326.1 protein of unknown function [Azospirillum baldaniorum]
MLFIIIKFSRLQNIHAYKEFMQRKGFVCYFTMFKVRHFWLLKFFSSPNVVKVLYHRSSVVEPTLTNPTLYLLAKVR